MTTFLIKFETKSDATFGRGDGLASLIDAEVQHDKYGLPFLGGRSLKGLLEEECANILFALKQQFKYSFCWNDVLENDNEELINFLKDNYNLEWLESAEIDKSTDGKIISVLKENNRVEIIIDQAKEKATLKINNNMIDNLKIEMSNDKLNVYQNKDRDFKKAAKHLFGKPGSTDSDKAILHISDAKLPKDLQNAIASELENNKLEREQVLNSLTNIRRQTAISESGVPKEGSLRVIRVILRETPFEAELSFDQDPSDMDLPLLAACVKAFRIAGTGRNRGRGELTARLCNEKGEDVIQEYFKIFEKKVMK